MKLISLLYNKINWNDKPSTNTPINAANLGKMDKGIDDITKALTDNNVSFNFGYDGTNYGYYKNGESTLTTFKTTHTDTKTVNTVGTTDMGVDHKYRYIQTSGLMVEPTDTKSITSNGNNQDVKNYSKVNVNVPNSYSNSGAILGAYGTTSGNYKYLDGFVNGGVYLVCVGAHCHYDYAANNFSLSGCDILVGPTTSGRFTGMSDSNGHAQAWIVKMNSTRLTVGAGGTAFHNNNNVYISAKRIS